MALYVLSGMHKGAKIMTPNRLETRPATSLLRGMVFDSCQLLIEDARILDLFSGSGAMGIEGLSRGANFVTFNDLSPECTKIIHANLRHLHLEDKADVLTLDSFQLLTRLQPPLPYDLILLHPPYPIGVEGYTRLLELVHTRADLLAEGGRIFLEVSGPLDKALAPVIERLFHVHKRKGRSTWILYQLTP